MYALCHIIDSIGTHIGPLSSSYEAEEDADPYFRRYCCPNKAPSALLIIFVGEIIIIVIIFIILVSCMFNTIYSVC